MESKDKFPDVWKFCVVCVAGSSCERPHCPLNSARDRPLDLSIKSDGFKRPSVLKDYSRKRPTTLPIPGLMSARTASILDRDKSVPSKPAPYAKPELPFLSGFGNPYPYGRVLATGYMRKDKQKIAER